MSLEKAEVELKEEDAAKKSVADEQVKVEKNVVRVAQEVQKLEDDISAALNDQTTLQKSQVLARHTSRVTRHNITHHAAHCPLTPQPDQREEEHGERDEGHTRQRERDRPSGQRTRAHQG
jgi:hypothetical protein